MPIISLSGLLSLVEWLEHRRASSQGGLACDNQKKGGSPPTKGDQSYGPVEQALEGSSRASPATDTADTDARRDADRVASLPKGGDV